jgi:outer membrane protein OmpA-like peptidoglycan-associated protein
MRFPQPSAASIAIFALLFGVCSCVSLNNGLLESAQANVEYSAIESPRLEISLRKALLRLEGHTASTHHERRLLQRVDKLFSDSRTSTVFKPLGTAPDHWIDSSLSVPNALSTTQSSQATLTNDALRLHGVAGGDWHDTVQTLRAALPKSIEFNVDMITPDEDVLAGDLCSRAFSAYQSGPVGFEESSTVLRSSAKLVLDRVISVADTYHGSAISITGHTDSSGSKASNLALSLARANAVADYIADRGIARARLLTIGAGSSQPLADNRTRHGRSLQRRIDIRMRQFHDAAAFAQTLLRG